MSIALLVTQLSGCSPSVQSQCNLLKQYFVEVESNSASEYPDPSPRSYELKFEEMPQFDGNIGFDTSVWFGAEDQALTYRYQSDSYRPAREFSSQRQLEDRFGIIERIAENECAEEALQPLISNYKKRFWTFDEALIEKFLPCASKLEEASLEPNGDWAEPILYESLNICENSSAWIEAIYEYPEALGVTSADGSEIDLMCSRYSDTKVCLSRN